MARQPSPRPAPPGPVGADRPWAEEFALRSILEATADKAGKDFFRDLVKHLALALDVAYAFVAEFAGSPTRVRTIALWGNGDWLDNIEYDLAGTPCQEVLSGSHCHYRDGVQEKFPSDQLLVELGARSFLGVPLRSASGETLGHLAVIDERPLPEDPRRLALFRVFADRARVELERLRVEETLRRGLNDLEVEISRRGHDLEVAHEQLELARSELEVLLAINQAVSKHLHREALFEEVARQLGTILPLGRLVIFLDDDRTAVIHAVRGESETIQLVAGERISHQGSLVGAVFERGQAIVPAGLDKVRERYPLTYAKLEQEGMQAVCALPLISGERCRGAMGLMAPEPDAYRDVSLRLLEEIGTAVAVALDNSLAYESLERMGQELEALLAVNVAVGRQLRRDELFRSLAGCLRDLLPSDRFGIELPAEDEKLETHILSPVSSRTEPARVERLPAAGTACRWVQLNRQWLVASCRDELVTRFPVTFEVMKREGMQSLAALPLVTAGRSLGVLFFMAAQEGAYENPSRRLLDQVASAVAVALDNCLAHEELERLRDRLAAENVYLQEEIRQQHDFHEIVGRSPALLEVLAEVEVVARTDSTVVIFGETGTGKELVARAIHDRSRRRQRPLVKVNCSAISAGLVESELFGHVKGAFTGAVSSRQGRFEVADGGTIFLDEIGELAPDTQVKLLRVLQEQEFEPVGSSQTRRVDVRVIAATNRDLERAVEDGSFRADLYYRLNVMPIVLPPLRERREDIPLLVSYFLDRYARELGKQVDGVSRDTMTRLTAYPWPGNVRELQNIVERAVVLCDSRIVALGPGVLPSVTAGSVKGNGAPRAEGPAPAANGSLATLEEVERRHMLTALERTGWCIEGPQGAARLLDLNPSTLRSRMKKLGLRRPAPDLSTG